MNYQIYKISEIYLSILSEIEEAEGELTPELEAKLSFGQDKLGEVVTNFTGSINMLQGNIDAANKEILRLQDFVKRKQKVQDTLRSSLLSALLLFGKEDKKGVKRLQFDTVELSTRKSTSTEILNVELVPDDYKLVDVSLSNLSLKALEGLKRLLNGERETLEQFEETKNLIHSLKETIKVSKDKLKPVIEEQQPEKEKDLIALEFDYKEGNITEAEYKEGLDKIDEKYPLLKGAVRETKYSLVIK